MSGGGATVIAAGATLNLSGGATKTLSQRSVTNYGTVVWSGAGKIMTANGAPFYNEAGGVFEVQNDGVYDRDIFNAAGAIHNAGLFWKTAGAGTTTIQVPFHNTGTIEVQTGTLQFPNRYYPTASSAFHFGLRSSTDFGRVQITGAATLTGKLGAALLDGFVPGTNDAFQVMSFASRTGEFGDYSGLYVGWGIHLKPVITATAVTLVGISIVPPVVILTSPSQGAVFPAPGVIPLAATATDSNGFIVRVEFYADGRKVGEDTTEPYAMSWTNVPGGAYTLRARAVDDQDAWIASSPVAVTVEAACVPPPASLVAWWPMESPLVDEAQGIVPVRATALSFVEGQVGSAVRYGSGGVLDFDHNESLANQQFTWHAWVRPEGAGPNNDAWGNAIINRGTYSGTLSYSLNWRATDSRFMLQVGAQNQSEVISSSTWPTGAFYHVVGTWDGQTAKLYVNGQLEGQRNVPGPIQYEASIPWAIGCNAINYRNVGYPRTWNGVIDEVAIFNQALTAEEINALYFSSNVGLCRVPYPDLVVSNVVAPAVASAGN